MRVLSLNENLDFMRKLRKFLNSYVLNKFQHKLLKLSNSRGVGRGWLEVLPPLELIARRIRMLELNPDRIQLEQILLNINSYISKVYVS